MAEQATYFATPQEREDETIVERINRKNLELSIELGIIKPPEVQKKQQIIDDFNQVVKELYQKMGKEPPKKYVLELTPEQKERYSIKTNLRNYAVKLEQLGY